MVTSLLLLLTWPISWLLHGHDDHHHPPDQPQLEARVDPVRGRRVVGAAVGHVSRDPDVIVTNLVMVNRSSEGFYTSVFFQSWT